MSEASGMDEDMVDSWAHGPCGEVEVVGGGEDVSLIDFDELRTLAVGIGP